MIVRTASKMRALLADFSGKLPCGLSKPAQRFVSEALYGIAARGSVRLSEIGRTLVEVFDHVEVFGEEDDILSGGRTTFVLFASGTPSGLDHIGGLGWLLFVKFAPAMLDKLPADRRPPLLTDDYAPIDWLVGIGEL